MKEMKHITLLLLYLVAGPIVVQPRPGCTFTWDVTGIAAVVVPAEAAKACQADLMRKVTISGSRANLKVVLSYAIDLSGTPVAGTPLALGALRNAQGAWGVWRSAFGGVRKFTIKFQDRKEQDLCWFTFAEEAGEVPTVNRCVQVVQ